MKHHPSARLLFIVKQTSRSVKPHVFWNVSQICGLCAVSWIVTARTRGLGGGGGTVLTGVCLFTRGVGCTPAPSYNTFTGPMSFSGGWVGGGISQAGQDRARGTPGYPPPPIQVRSQVRQEEGVPWDIPLSRLGTRWDFGGGGPPVQVRMEHPPNRRARVLDTRRAVCLLRSGRRTF